MNTIPILDEEQLKGFLLLHDVSFYFMRDYSLTEAGIFFSPVTPEKRKQIEDSFNEYPAFQGWKTTGGGTEFDGYGQPAHSDISVEYKLPEKGGTKCE